jgi:DNA-binding beta-propeller fold protein YncE
MKRLIISNLIRLEAARRGATLRGTDSLRALRALLLLAAMLAAVVAVERTAFAQPAGANSGWLYIVDTKRGATTGQVLVLDPEQGRVVKTFATGMSPDIALSPDGKYLYVASTRQGQADQPAREELSIIETASGRVTQTVDNADRAYYNVQPAYSNMAFSPSGRWLYVSKLALVGPQTILYWVATLDTRTNKFLPDKAEIHNCGSTQLLPLDKERQLQVVCTDTMDVRAVKIMPGGAAAALTTKLKRPGRAPKADIPAYSFLASDGSNTTVTVDGRILKVDTAGQTAMEVAAVNVPSSRWIHSGARSPDRNRVYISLQVPAEANQGQWIADRINAYDLRNLNQLGAVETSRPFSHLTVSRDGRFIYAVDTDGAKVLVIDTATMKEMRIINNVGVSPSLALSVP